MDSGAIYDFIFEDIKKKLDDPSVIYTLHTKAREFTPIPCDVPVIDDILEGGLPEGRIVELYGPEASGKTTLMLHFVAAAQRRGYVVYFIDAEQALDMAYAERIGVQTKRLLFSQPDYGEQALETARAICESTALAKEKFKVPVKSLIVIDSVPALVPRDAYNVYEKEGFDHTIALGASARMLAQLLPPLVTKAGKAGVTVVFINQERDKIGVVYGSPTTTPGGRALKFFSSLRLKVNRVGYYERGGERAGIRTQMVPIKSKMFPIFGRKAEFIIGENGINLQAALATALIEAGVFTKAGAWFKCGSTSIQGVAGIEDLLTSKSEFAKYKALLESKKQGDVVTPAPSPVVVTPKVAGVVQPLVKSVPIKVTSPAPAAQLPPQSEGMKDGL